MRYLSLFSGIGGFELGIQKVLPHAECLGYSEIDRHALKVYEDHFSHKCLGDVTQINFKCFNGIDLLVGGSPCQSLSIQTKDRKHLDGKSKLFFDFARAVTESRPRYFILENVSSMTEDVKLRIIKTLEEGSDSKVWCTRIVSDHFTPQKRARYFFTNFEVSKPTACGPRWPNLVAWSKSTRYPEGKPSYVEERETRDGRANTLVTGIGCAGQSTKNYIEEDGIRRILTPEECEELQGLPIGWTNLSPTRERYRQIGNAVTPAVIEHIIKQLNS